MVESDINRLFRWFYYDIDARIRKWRKEIFIIFTKGRYVV